ncbi:hypothetical protein OQA88_7199 [Cercophora sp. LCS_1]
MSYLHDLRPSHQVGKALSGSKNVIRELIEQYGDGLSQEAASDLESKTGQFVKAQASGIANKIVSAFQRAPLDTKAVDHPQKEDGPGEALANNDLGYGHVGVRLVEAFLFESGAYYALQRNAESQVRTALNATCGDIIGGWVRLNMHRGLAKLAEPPLPPGMTRLRFTCNHCSLPLYDDYQELRPGAVDRLKSVLTEYNRTTPDSIHPKAGVKTPSFASTFSTISGIYKRGRNATPLPTHTQPKINTSNPYGCNDIPLKTPSRAHHHFLLLCLPFMRFGTKLHQSAVCRINSDQDFFHLLRSRYISTKRKDPSKWLLRAKSIEFVQFEVFSSEVVGIQAKPSLPSQTLRDSYHYEPMPSETLPPIGPNTLIHFFEHPSHAGVVPILYRRIPKKLKEKLVACPRIGSLVGWGI